MTPDELWRFLPFGYLLTIAIETPVLVVGLATVHPVARRVLAGMWLTACTYPIVVLVLPILIPARVPYLVVAETFAPVAECILFGFAFGNRDTRLRDSAAIAVANLLSFGLGLLLV